MSDQPEQPKVQVWFLRGMAAAILPDFPGQAVLRIEHSNGDLYAAAEPDLLRRCAEVLLDVAGKLEARSGRN